METQGIQKKFEESTKDLLAEESRIMIFERIRNIPFAIVPEFFWAEKGPLAMLEQNRGFCVPKHYLLGGIFQKMGMRVQYHTYSFKWSELNINFPPKLKNRAKDIPVTYHLACKILIDNEWRLVDATWDPALKNAGFTVNEKWDGSSDTQNAVKPLEEFVHENIQAREEMFKAKIGSYTFSEKLKLFRFSAALNSWLNEVRLSKDKAESVLKVKDTPVDSPGRQDQPEDDRKYSEEEKSRRETVLNLKSAAFRGSPGRQASPGADSKKYPEEGRRRREMSKFLRDQLKKLLGDER